MTISPASPQNAEVEEATSGTSAAFRALFTSEYDFVTRSLVRLGVGDADAPDVAQELFLAVLNNLSTRDTSRPVRPWLFGYAAKYAANYRRLGWQKRQPLDPEPAPVSPRLGERLSVKVAVTRALAALADEQREALIMHDLEEFTGAEIAAELGVPMFTVYSRVRLARAAVRAELARLGQLDGKEGAPS